MIKYLGSKRRLVPVITGLAVRAGARTCLDLFTGTTRVARGLKHQGAIVTAVDTARYSEILARAAIETDGGKVDVGELERVIAHLDGLPGRPGYVTATFCEQSRFFQPHNGARIDAIRDAIAKEHAGTPFEPLLLASLLESADRVDSTTGVQMAYVKSWAPRSYNRLELRVPELIEGTGHAVRGDAVRSQAAWGVSTSLTSTRRTTSTATRGTTTSGRPWSLGTSPITTGLHASASR